jgi:hypothetical protein
VTNIAKTFVTPTPTQTQMPHNISSTTPIPKALETQVVILQNQVATLEYIVTEQNSIYSSSPELNSVRKNQESLDKRLSSIEQVIFDNPEKSLELTFMRREIDNMKITYQSETERTLREIERVYSQNNWFIGLMFTIAIGMIGLAVGNFFKGPDKEDKSKKTDPNQE